MNPLVAAWSALAPSTALPWLEPSVLALYYATLGVLALFGSHRFFLLWAWWRSEREGQRSHPVLPEDPVTWPRVTVQLPLYNERFVAERLIAAVAALDYPANRLEIQVLDDSTDDTREIVRRAIECHATEQRPIAHLHRRDRQGYKAGALAAGMNTATGELLCVFDADFVPRPDFLRRLVPHFEDPEVGMVQARWEHLNREDSLLTRVQAILLDGHFAIEHAARHAGGCFFNFNGTGGIWRRRAIEDAGGWTADTLTEDLDLSYRAQLAGWRFVYRADVTVPAELPRDVPAFKSQQFRWARGSIQTGRKLLPRILRADLPGSIRREAFIHLTNNLSYPLMILLAALVFPAMAFRRGSEAWKLLAIDAPLFLAASVSVLLFYLASQAAVGRSWPRAIRYLPAVMATGIGLAVSNTLAVLGGLWRNGGVFHRTPKTGDRAGATGSVYRLPRQFSWWIEGALATYFLAGTTLAIKVGMWLSVPFLYLFLQGFTYLFVLPLLNPDPIDGTSDRAPLPAEEAVG